MKEKDMDTASINFFRKFPLDGVTFSCDNPSKIKRKKTETMLGLRER